ncbi:MAG: DNA-processing protein DprA [Ginsengibacter sp.]|jgi:DNA processing protein
MSNELLYQIALTLVPHIGDVHAKALVQHFGSAEAIFKASKKDLIALDGIGVVRATELKKFNDFHSAEKEIEFVQKYSIKTLFLTDSDYPQRLLNCYDSPPLLYYKGNADLNASKIMAVVGTRTNDDYGKSLCEKLIEELALEGITVISGLAFGIDSIAHKACIKQNVKTIGVLAHGLDRVYPSQNASLAKQMTKDGGLLTEFKSKTNPDRQNFPARNRIVAGLSDCVVVIQTGIKGGSLITAELGNGYNKDVYAFPGRINDSKSEGCNYLIKTNKAGLLTSASDLLLDMGWVQPTKVSRKKQRELFIELTADEKIIIEVLKESNSIHIDELYFKSKLSSSSIAQALLMLEMQGIVDSLPGKIYKLGD